MNYCFVDKNKDNQRFLAANMESLAETVKGNINHKNLEHFHEAVCGYTDILPITFMQQKITLIITSVV